MSETTSKEVATTNYRALTVSGSKLKEIVEANTGASGISAHELDRIKVPAGGGSVWEIPTLNGSTETKELEGIIIKWKDVRGYWPEKFNGAGTPPQCSSDDAVTGFGIPGGSCLTCPLAQFESAPGKKPGEHGKGQACKASRLLFMLRPNNLLPIVVALPPTSIRPARDYFRRLINEQLAHHHIITNLTLTKDKSKDGGITYSKAQLSMKRELNPDEKVRVADIVEAFMPVFARTRMQVGDVTDAA